MHDTARPAIRAYAGLIGAQVGYALVSATVYLVAALAFPLSRVAELRTPRRQSSYPPVHSGPRNLQRRRSPRRRDMHTMHTSW